VINPKKEATQIVDNKVEIAVCPNCESVTTHMYFMQDAATKQQSKWYSCSCGIVWQAHYKGCVYDQAYLDNLPTGSKYDTALKAIPKIIAPLAEEMMYGRKMLMIGHYPSQIEEFKRRGWVTFSIDKNTAYTTSERMIAADFETFQFAEDEKYSMIWAYHVIESFNNPFESLKKAFSLLAEDGIIFIGTPDSDFLYTRGPAGFVHWKRDYNHILWNRKSLTSYLEKLGFNVVLARKNYEPRFPFTDDIWLLAQKRFY